MPKVEKACEYVKGESMFPEIKLYTFWKYYNILLCACVTVHIFKVQ